MSREDLSPGERRAGWLGTAGVLLLVGGEVVALAGAGLLWQNGIHVAIIAGLMMVAGLALLLAGLTWRHNERNKRRLDDELNKILRDANPDWSDDDGA